MLIAAILLGILGAILVYIGNTDARKRAFRWVGLALLAVAAIFLALFLVDVLDDENVDTALILLT